MTKYFQCKFRKGNSMTTAWIEERGAKIGNSVELQDIGFWEVIEVGNYSMSQKHLREHQNLNRESLSSIQNS